MKKLYDFYGKEIIGFQKLDNMAKVYYVKCDCGHLAIHKNNTAQAVFRCSLCRKEYQLRMTGKVKEIGTNSEE
ncbi:transcriptional regulator, UvrC family [Enterococcus faecalis 02-MB-P-10]|uniref:hypothetical protein n=1 Tax=Enterococcus faecalis TaxID=1351 RepID=UPI00035442F9|nr:hypothetical protein [Enterococcus faecalis]EPH77720.1 transcriptional regulator, UvrC family [Enterococcus faecalis 02-MB-P-10]